MHKIGFILGRSILCTRVRCVFFTLVAEERISTPAFNESRNDRFTGFEINVGVDCNSTVPIQVSFLSIVRILNMVLKLVWMFAHETNVFCPELNRVFGHGIKVCLLLGSLLGFGPEELRVLIGDFEGDFEGHYVKSIKKNTLDHTNTGRGLLLVCVFVFSRLARLWLLDRLLVRDFALLLVRLRFRLYTSPSVLLLVCDFALLLVLDFVLLSFLTTELVLFSLLFYSVSFLTTEPALFSPLYSLLTAINASPYIFPVNPGRHNIGVNFY